MRSVVDPFFVFLATCVRVAAANLTFMTNALSFQRFVNGRCMSLLFAEASGILRNNILAGRMKKCYGEFDLLQRTAVYRLGLWNTGVLANWNKNIQAEWICSLTSVLHTTSENLEKSQLGVHKLVSCGFYMYLLGHFSMCELSCLMKNVMTLTPLRWSVTEWPRVRRPSSLSCKERFMFSVSLNEFF